MSWGVSVSKKPVGEFLDALHTATLNDTYNAPELVAQWQAQLQAAKAAAEAMFAELTDSGQRLDGSLSANLSGHANHGEAADTSGYMKDEYISVTVNWTLGGQ